MLSSSKFASVGRRCFRSVPDNINLSHPRLAIAKNILKLRKITDANCEASVRAALKDSVSVEDVAAQPCLTAFEINLLSTTAKTYHAPFVRSTLVWQNQPFLKYVYNEFMKLENFGFLVGFACLGWFCAYFLPTSWAAVQPDKRRTSKYLSQLEGRHGYIRTKEEHARYLAGEDVPHSKGH